MLHKIEIGDCNEVEMGIKNEIKNGKDVEMKAITIKQLKIK